MTSVTSVCFYVKAGLETGWGHLFRCLALAQELRGLGADCSFLTEPAAIERIDAAGFDACGFNPNLGPFPSCDVIVVDLEGGCPPILAQQVRPKCDTFVILNGVGYPDGDPGRLVADLVVYQGVTRRPYNLDWSGFEGEWFEGVKWLILRREFSELRAAPLDPAGPYKVVILGGGSDPMNVTQTVIDALAGVPNVSLLAIIGPSNQRQYDAPGVEFIHDPPNIAECMARANTAVVSYGMTAFECLALGLPTVALSISPDHAASARLLQAQLGGAFLSLGEAELMIDITKGDKLVQTLTRGASNMIMAALAVQTWQIPNLSKIARRLVDGRGAERVARKIMEVANGNNRQGK